jgi:hypothetical protein
VTKYQDRIIYATDFARPERGAASLISTPEREWNFFAGTAEARWLPQK